MDDNNERIENIMRGREERNRDGEYFRKILIWVRDIIDEGKR